MQTKSARHFGIGIGVRWLVFKTRDDTLVIMRGIRKLGLLTARSLWCALYGFVSRDNLTYAARSRTRH